MEEVELASKSSEFSDNNPHSKTDQPMHSSTQKPFGVSFLGLFAAADKMDHLLMLFGSFRACIHDALYLIYLGIVLFISAWIGVASWTQTGERQIARLRLKCLQSVLRKDINFFDTEARDTNIIFHISSDAILVQDAIGDKTGHTLRYLSQFVVGFHIGFTSVWQLTLLTLVVVPLIAIAGGAYTIIMSTLSEKGEAAYAEAGKVTEEVHTQNCFVYLVLVCFPLTLCIVLQVISQIRTVYSFVGEDKAIETYSESLNKALKLGKKSGVAKGVGVGLTYGLFAVGQATPNLAAISKGRAAAANIMKMIESDSNSSKILDKGVELPKVSGQIEFFDVCFAYPSQPNMAFENLSFSISAGKNFAVVGPSGKILLDGHDISTLQLRWLREQMGLVSQEPALFATTIADNIMFGKEDANMDQIIEAAKAANAHSFIQGLPDGYNTWAGENSYCKSSSKKPENITLG
ncbi:putative xenobiotic-transporting ATPase [Rosa chinensis]|uniref:Putative xenobiotic-transporting ATPase n=1 Tax=Rosa chinensis TaxID=74649 RepID=A0A2P6PZA2_ROSCH|nr:putative xenobiotic-transporting ATPase [Rosa chinensis]